MTQMIHPQACVSDKATLGRDVKIGPFCTVGPDVTLEDGVELISHVVVDGDTHIGKETKVWPFASLGTIPQDLKFAGEKARLEIGARNRIREHVTMNIGTMDGGMLTKVGDDCLIMIGSHVAHDVIIGNHVILANNATLAGHVQVGDYAILGGLSAVRQFVRIGAHAMIGGMAGVEKDVIPYGMVKGERASLHGLNLVGLQRGGFSRDAIKNLRQAYDGIFAADGGSIGERVNAVMDNFGEDQTVRQMLDFIEGRGKLGLCQPPASSNAGR